MKVGKYKKVVIILTIIATIMIFINSNKVDSVVIIGGADGPTAIYLSSRPSSTIIAIVVFALLSITGIFYVILRKKKHK